MRLSLAAKILQSLEAEQTRPKKSLADLVGILETDKPPPTDEDVEQILEEERMRKYGQCKSCSTPTFCSMFS